MTKEELKIKMDGYMKDYPHLKYGIEGYIFDNPIQGELGSTVVRITNIRGKEFLITWEAIMYTEPKIIELYLKDISIS